MAAIIAERKAEEFERQRFVALEAAQDTAQAIGGLLAGVAQTKQASRSISRSAAKFDFVGILPMVKKARMSEEETRIPTMDSVLRTLGASRDGSIGKRG